MNKKAFSFSKYFEIDFLNGTLRHAKILMDELLNEYGEEATIEFECYGGYGPYDDCDKSCTVYWSRLETDQEYEERIKNEEELKKLKNKQAYERKKQKQQHEREEYERLKKKFEK